MRRLLLLCAVFGLAACSSQAPLATVAAVDLARYQGRWHEVARFDHGFQRGCVQSTADYALQDGVIAVTNRCTTASGTVREALGRAVPVAGRPAQFKVSFGFPSNLFTGHDGNYWIVALDAGYQWVVVGHPGRDYLWILARQLPLEAAVYQRLLAQAQAQGFAVGRLQQAPGAVR